MKCITICARANGLMREVYNYQYLSPRNGSNDMIVMCFLDFYTKRMASQHQAGGGGRGLKRGGEREEEGEGTEAKRGRFEEEDGGEVCTIHVSR